MKLAMMLLVGYSTILVLTSCATIKRPNVDLCIVNAPNKTRKCYNMERDYTSDGLIKPGAKAVYRVTESVEDLNKGLFVDSDSGPEDGLARLKAYIKKLREEQEKGCQQ